VGVSRDPLLNSANPDLREKRLGNKTKEEELVRVIHGVNQKMVFTECESVRGSNITGYIELLHVKRAVSKVYLRKKKTLRK
jgi:hypothetical protein